MCAAISPRIRAFTPAALAASNIGTWDFDVARDLFRCDDSAAIFYGLTAEEREAGVSIARVNSCLHPDDRARSRAKRRHMIEHGGLFVIEYRVLSPIGLRWVLVRGRFEQAARGSTPGEVTHARGIVIDVTESKQQGYAEGAALFMRAADLHEGTALDQAAGHALALRRAIDRLDQTAASTLRPAVDILLVAIGRCLGSLLSRNSNG